LVRGKCFNPYLQRAWDKYGENAFSFEVLMEAPTQKQLDELEIKLIKEHKSRNPRFGYNCRSGGARGKHTEETKRKLSVARTQFYNSNKGKQLKKYLSELAKNQSHSLEENVKRSKTLRKYDWDSPIVISPDGKKYVVHTVKGFCREHGIKHDGHFRRLIRGMRPQYKGWTLK